MKKIIASILLAGALAGCAATGTTTATNPTINPADAITQAQGAAKALETLAQTSPLDDKTKSQIAGYATWLDLALKAGGIVATMVGS